MPELPEKLSFCPRCGKAEKGIEDLPAPLPCPGCKKENMILSCCGKTFCYFCGHSIMEVRAGAPEGEA